MTSLRPLVVDVTGGASSVVETHQSAPEGWRQEIPVPRGGLRKAGDINIRCAGAQTEKPAKTINKRRRIYQGHYSEGSEGQPLPVDPNSLGPPASLWQPNVSISPHDGAIGDPTQDLKIGSRVPQSWGWGCARRPVSAQLTPCRGAHAQRGQIVENIGSIGRGAQRRIRLWLCRCCTASAAWGSELSSGPEFPPSRGGHLEATVSQRECLTPWSRLACYWHAAGVLACCCHAPRPRGSLKMHGEVLNGAHPETANSSKLRATKHRISKHLSREQRGLLSASLSSCAG